MSFALFSQMSVYAVTRREFNNAALQYWGVGAAEQIPPYQPPPESQNLYKFSLPYYLEADPRIYENYTEEERDVFSYEYGYEPAEIRYQPLTQGQIAAISGLPFIALSDRRYMTAGFSDKYSRLEEGEQYYNLNSRCIVEATLTEVRFAALSPSLSRSSIDYIPTYNRLTLDGVKLLAGNCPYAAENSRIIVDALSAPPVDRIMTLGGATRANWTYSPNYKYGSEYIETLKLGQRYVFVLSALASQDSVLYQETSPVSPFHLYDRWTESWCSAIWPIEGEDGDYLASDKYMPLRMLAEIIDTDEHIFDVVYTDGMSAIIRFAEGDMEIVDGRTLTKEDSENGAMLCVISHRLASAYSLTVGDTVTLGLGGAFFEQHKSIGAQAVTWQRYSPSVKTVTLEIVGIYQDTDSLAMRRRNPNWNYSINTIFVPKSLLQVDENVIQDHEFSPAEFSFMLDNAWHTAAFLEAAEPLFEELGLKLFFNDKGWQAIESEYWVAERLSLIYIVVFSTAVLIAIVFAVYLFIGWKKREYAIMRALGTPKKESSCALILPLMSVASVSVIVGSSTAWIYTVKTVAQGETLLLLGNYSVNVTIPVAVAFGCILGELLLTMLTAVLMLRRIGKASPFALLQGRP
jgi:hypothetical protein